MKLEFECEECHLVFDARMRGLLFFKAKKKFCSDKCKKNHYAHVHNKNCKHCNKQFNSRTRKLFCSIDCSEIYHRTRWNNLRKQMRRENKNITA